MSGSAIAAASGGSAVAASAAAPSAVRAAAPPGTVSAAGPAAGIAGAPPAAGIAAVSGPGGIAGQGGSGGSGAGPALALVALAIVPAGGTLTLDLAKGNTFRAALAGDVTAVALLNPPAAGLSQRVTLYLAQDAAGGHAVSGWPAAVRWAGGAPPAPSLAPNALECLVLDVLDGGATILGALVAQTYA